MPKDETKKSDEVVKGEVEKVGKNVAKGKAVKPKKPQENNKISREEYYNLKRRVLGWEKNNYTKLAVIKTENGWYKLHGNSAVIYACQIAKRLSMKVSLNSDTDYEETTDSPVVLIRNLDKFEESLKQLKIYRSSMDKGVYVYDLGYKVDATDIVAMQKENELLRERANKLVLPSEVFPGLRNELRLLAARAYEITRKMNPAAREMAGNDMVKICARMMENFVEAANGHTDMRQYLKTTVKDLRRVDAKLLLMLDLRLVDDNKNYQMMVQVGKAQRKLAAALLKVEKGIEKDS